MTKGEARALGTLFAIHGQQIDLNNVDGEELTAEEAGAKLAVALDEAEATTDESGERNPLGYRLAVNITLDGLSGEELVLVWSLYGDGEQGQWEADRLGVRFTPTTDQDGGTVYVWVPDLEAPGEHRVEVQIHKVSDSSLLTTGYQTCQWIRSTIAASIRTQASGCRGFVVRSTRH